MDSEVAVFIDFENLRYGLLNYYGMEPDFQEIVLKARKYGRPSTMRAYADFSEHPPELSRALQIAGIEAITIPVKRTINKGSNCSDDQTGPGTTRILECENYRSMGSRRSA